MAENGNVLLLILCLFIVLSDASCPSGKFGWKCQFDCGCKNNEECDPVTGHCPNGCKSALYGPNCILANPFIYDSTGKYYTGTINITESGKSCVSWNTQTLKEFFKLNDSQFADGKVPGAVCRNPEISAKNKTSPWCFINAQTLREEKCLLTEITCPKGRYGNNCVKECHCQGLEACDTKTGKCSQCYDGWIGLACQEKCESGKYGPDCKLSCGECKNNSCDHETGHCLEGCNPGWKGELCNTNCSSGEYGENCNERCGKCRHDADCDVYTGKCPSGCKDGYIGTNCEKPCKIYWYGYNCTEQCGHCSNIDLCDHIDGSCPNGCEDGWINDNCAEPCMDGWYGRNCSMECGNCMDDGVCDKVNGACPNGCSKDFSGGLCKLQVFAPEETSSAGIHAAIISVFVIVILAVLIMVYIL